MFGFRRVGSRLGGSRGQTMTEYALLLAGVAVAALAGYNSLGASTNASVNSASALLASDSGGTTLGGSGSGTGTGGGSGSTDPGSDGGSGSSGGHHHHHGDGSGHHHHYFF